LHIDDLAAAAIFLMNNYDSPEIVNVGVEDEVSIAQLVELVKSISGCSSKIVFDPSKPDGTPRRKMDISKIKSLGGSQPTPCGKASNPHMTGMHRMAIRQGFNAVA